MSLVRPWRRERAITDVDVDELAASGVRCVLFDRDNTVVPRDIGVAPESVMDWICRVREAGIALCMVSNNFHSQQVEASAAELGCAVVHHAMKPAPFAVRRALAIVGVDASEAVLIGDQVFTDVMAGNLAGVRTILVEPQSTSDLWYTHIFRVFERAIGARR
ncbi:YqeG family HAD IIIA-type phosphatase [uncultured Parolsenella sp.]|uniref:YqeG family HAD IIIA-type phosphatase n=1 Tax=uncultured Parolsenella sp. TaxID=2083008 RepID=UPI0027DC984E|nr:YqeG family HAD IIIA-type phosphatase [uncultured Parolsenella sp.]